MALIKCHECNKEMSSSAAACPNCGAPRRVNLKAPIQPAALGIIVLLIAGLLVYVAARDRTDSAPESHTEKIPEVPAAAEVAPAPPSHLFALKDGARYGYERGISEEDQKSNVGAEPLTEIYYLGQRGGRYEVLMPGPGAHQILSCTEPCEFYKIRSVVMGSVIDTQDMRSVPGTIAWSIMEDARNHLLDVWKKPIGQDQYCRLWLDDQNIETCEPIRIASAATNPENMSSGIQPSFNCAKARSDAERLICSDAALAQMDIELKRLYDLAEALAPDPKEFKEETRAAWEAREESCHDRACVQTWFENRQQVLKDEIAADRAQKSS